MIYFRSLCNRDRYGDFHSLFRRRSFTIAMIARIDSFLLSGDAISRATENDLTYLASVTQDNIQLYYLQWKTFYKNRSRGEYIQWIVVGGIC